jgi:hypothetical protein
VCRLLVLLLRRIDCSDFIIMVDDNFLHDKYFFDASRAIELIEALTAMHLHCIITWPMFSTCTWLIYVVRGHSLSYAFRWSESFHELYDGGEFLVLASFMEN